MARHNKELEKYVTVKNKSQHKSFKLKEGESWKKTFKTVKNTDDRPSWEGKKTKKMCIKYHILGNCFDNCDRLESHVPKDQIPAVKVTEMCAFITKCRNRGLGRGLAVPDHPVNHLTSTHYHSSSPSVKIQSQIFRILQPLWLPPDTPPGISPVLSQITVLGPVHVMPVHRDDWINKDPTIIKTSLGEKLHNKLARRQAKKL